MDDTIFLVGTDSSACLLSQGLLRPIRLRACAISVLEVLVPSRRRSTTTFLQRALLHIFVRSRLRRRLAEHRHHKRTGHRRELAFSHWACLPQDAPVVWWLVRSAPCISVEMERKQLGRRMRHAARVRQPAFRSVLSRCGRRSWRPSRSSRRPRRTVSSFVHSVHRRPRRSCDFGQFRTMLVVVGHIRANVAERPISSKFRPARDRSELQVTWASEHLVRFVKSATDHSFRKHSKNQD